MENMVPASRKNYVGFTVIEVLIVVCIIGIIACLAIPVFLDHKDKAIVGVTKANLEVIRSGLSQYAAHSINNTYPTGSLNYPDFRITVPQTNLPPLESEAMMVSGSFLYSGDGATYFLQVTSINRTAERFKASPGGILKY